MFSINEQTQYFHRNMYALSAVSFVPLQSKNSHEPVLKYIIVSVFKGE